MGLPEPHRPRTRRDPTEWRPKDNREYEAVDITVTPERVVSDSLRYGSLADHEGIESLDTLRAIEQNALAQLRQVMNYKRLHPDERSLRVRWTLQVEGQGYKAPEGFIHPEAPEDIQRESQAAWKRCVESATDSLANIIFVRVWRRKQRGLGAASTRLREIEAVTKYRHPEDGRICRWHEQSKWWLIEAPERDAANGICGREHD